MSGNVWLCKRGGRHPGWIGACRQSLPAAIAVSPDHRFAACSFAQDSKKERGVSAVIVFDLLGAHRKQTILRGLLIDQLAWSPTGREIAGLDEHGGVYLFRLGAGRKHARKELDKSRARPPGTAGTI
jgi:hypothetical protein